PRHARHAPDHRLLFVVTQIQTEHAEASVIQHLVVLDEVVVLQDPRDLGLQLGHRQVNAPVLRLRSIPDARQHVGDRIGHHGDRASYSIRTVCRTCRIDDDVRALLLVRLLRTAGPGPEYETTKLPARLPHSRDLALQRHLPEADPAQPELAQERARPAAAVAAVVVTDLELGPLLLALDQCLACHPRAPQAALLTSTGVSPRNGMPSSRSSA